MRWEASGTWAGEKHRQGKREAASSTRAEEGPGRSRGPLHARVPPLSARGVRKFSEART